MSKNDPIRENALARREAALAEARRWDEFLCMYDQLSGGGGGETVPSNKPPHDKPASRTKRSRTRSRAAETAQLAYEILTSVGGPLTTRALLREMEARGYKVGGRNPVATLHTRLNRSASVVFERPNGWRVRAGSETTRAAGTATALTTTALAEATATPHPVDDAEPQAGDQTEM